VKKLITDSSLNIIIVEPHIGELPDSLKALPGLKLTNDPASAIEEADVIALLVAHWQFYGMSKKAIEEKRDRIIDATGIWHDILKPGC